MDHLNIIRLWPSASTLASDLNMAGSKGTRLINMWAYRKAIPPKRFPEIVAAAKVRGFDHVTLQSLYSGASCTSGATQ